MTDEHQTFAKLVRRMRDAQKLFFKTKLTKNLERAVALEKLVDIEIRKMNLPAEEGEGQSQELPLQ